MMNLSNKNKRRGFKRSMASVLPSKIIFEDEQPDGVGSSSTPQVDMEVHASGTPNAALPTSRLTASFGRHGSNANPSLPRLVPPSEKQEMGVLPGRMFVTSVDVEEGMWPKKGGKKRNGKEKQTANGYNYGERENVGDYEGGTGDGKKRKRKEKNGWDISGYGEDEEDVVLPYDDESAEALMMSGNVDERESKGDLVFWAKAENDWDTLPVSTRAERRSLPTGTVVAWKVRLSASFTIDISRRPLTHRYPPFRHWVLILRHSVQGSLFT